MAPVKLSDKDVDALIRVVATEADHKLAWSHPEEYTAQVHGIVDTILNRVASGRWGSSVASVANAKGQFSAINGPRGRNYTVYGSVDKVPDRVVPGPLRNIVTSWVTRRGAGTPSSVGGALNYANPFKSDAANLKWINKLDGPQLGYGKSIHYHGTTAGYSPVEATVIYGGGINRLNDIHDRQAAVQGYGEIAPTALKRPAFFNETGSPPIPLPRRIAPAQSLMSESKAPSLADLPMKSAPNLRPAPVGLGITPRLGTTYNPPAADARYNRIMQAFVPEDEITAMVNRGQKTVSPVGLGTLDLAMRDARSLPKPPVSVRVPTGPNADPVGRGATLADLGRFTSPSVASAPTARAGFVAPAQSLMSSSDNNSRYDPTGTGASFSDVKRFNPPPRTSGIAGTAQIPWDVTPQIPEIIPASAPQTTTKTVTKTIMVPNPEWGKVNPVAVNKLQDIHDREGARIMAAQTPAAPAVPQFIPKQVTQTINVPLPVAPVPAPVSQKLMARARALPPTPTLQQAFGNWWNGTPIGGLVNAVTGNKPQTPATGGGMLGGGGLLGAAMSLIPRQQIAMNVAAQAQRDPLGYAIGQANRASPQPTYDVSGGNNSFNPISVQNSSRWQTGY